MSRSTEQKAQLVTEVLGELAVAFHAIAEMAEVMASDIAAMSEIWQRSKEVLND
jgi:hypothetical protein